MFKNSSLLYVTLTKEKNHIIISTDADKALGKIQHSFMFITLSKIGRERNCLT